MKLRAWTLSVMLILAFVGFLSAAEAAGPWQALVVDAETGQPLEGVVILAVWIKYTASPAGWAGGKFYDSEEVVTGLDGRFVIPKRLIINWLPLFTQIRGPEFTIFKPGYGEWRVRHWSRYPPEWKELTDSELLEKPDIVIELLPLKTREERLKFYYRFGWSSLVPAERTKHLREAENMERAYLGFQN